MTTLLLVLIEGVALLLQQNNSVGATVAGSVVRLESNAPIDGARVLLARLDAHLSASLVTTTNAEGRFSFNNVPPGRYRAFAEHDDYVRREYATAIEVNVGTRNAAVAFTLTPLGSITGRIVNEFGEPASAIFVRAITTRVVGETKTNDLGEYRLFGLPPAAYIVSAERYQGPRIEVQQRPGAAGRTDYVVPGPPSPDSPGEGQNMQPLTTVLQNGGFIDPRALTGKMYPVVFYPGTTERSAASTIEVKPGAEVRGIDLQLVVR